MTTVEKKNSDSEIDRLREELASVYQQLRNAQDTIRRAKDISPVVKPSLKRVMDLAQAACLTIQKVAGGWLLKLGHRFRRFRSLKEIWEILITDFALSDLFPDNCESWVKPRYPHRRVSIAPGADFIKSNNYKGLKNQPWAKRMDNQKFSVYEEIPFT